MTTFSFYTEDSPTSLTVAPLNVFYLDIWLFLRFSFVFLFLWHMYHYGAMCSLLSMCDSWVCLNILSDLVNFQPWFFMNIIFALFSLSSLIMFTLGVFNVSVTCLMLIYHYFCLYVFLSYFTFWIFIFQFTNPVLLHKICI